MEINFENFPIIALAVVFIFEVAIGVFLYKRKFRMKIVIPIFVIIFLIIAVLLSPTLYYERSNNPRIPENMRLNNR